MISPDHSTLTEGTIGATHPAKQPWQTPLLILGQLDATRNGGGHHGDYTNASQSPSSSAADVFAPS